MRIPIENGAPAAGDAARTLHGKPPLGRARVKGQGEMTRPWTEAETRRLKALAHEKVSAEDRPKAEAR
jgi:hypothetical protein